MGVNYGPAGITMNDTLMNLLFGWFVVYNDGTLVTEDDTHWNVVRKGEIKVLGLKWRDRIWTVTGKTAYLQFKRGSVPFSTDGVSHVVNCEERCIGYYEGNQKVIYRVNNRTGQMKPEVQGPQNGNSSGPNKSSI